MEDTSQRNYQKIEPRFVAEGGVKDACDLGILLRGGPGPPVGELLYALQDAIKKKQAEEELDSRNR
jgi:hypothetical protein